MKVVLAQINSKVGDFARNREKIAAVLRGTDRDALVIFPECAICGYPPLDLVEHPSFVEQCEESIGILASEFPEHSFLLGTVRSREGRGRKLVNSAVFISGGRIHAAYAKRLLPTYDVFDEDRYFEPGDQACTIEFNGKKFFVSICEDLWFDAKDTRMADRYSSDPLADSQGVDYLVNLSASPFEKNKNRLEIFSDVANKVKTPLICVNAVGGNDELIFDGRSAVWNARGELCVQVAAFQESVEVIDLSRIQPISVATAVVAQDSVELLYDALICGLRDFVLKQGMRSVVLGLSGGVDSALVACLACDALGPENVRLVLMPSRYTSADSNVDAVQLAKTTQSPLHILSIEGLFPMALKTLETSFEGLKEDVTEENLQSRIRGLLLMALSNKFGDLVLACGNKSEMATGYCTLYGDMAGGLAPIGDLYKSEVYALAREANRRQQRIPERVFIKAPSAELKPDQKDQDSLPPYDVLDPLLEGIIEKRFSKDELLRAGFKKKDIEFAFAALQKSEFKRKQAAPILKVSSKAFGIGRRYPIVARFF